MCFESVEPHTARIGIMFIHVDGSASAGSRGRFAARRRLGSANCANCANCANPCMHCRHNPSPRGNGNCTNCPTPFCLQNLSPYSGTKEFPVAAARACALLCRVAGIEGRSGDWRSAKPAAGIGVSPNSVRKRVAETAGIAEDPIASNACTSEEACMLRVR